MFPLSPPLCRHYRPRRRHFHCQRDCRSRFHRFHNQIVIIVGHRRRDHRRCRHCRHLQPYRHHHSNRYRHFIISVVIVVVIVNINNIDIGNVCIDDIDLFSTH